MVDQEVENTLREIRERVLAESRSRSEAPASPTAGQSLTPGGEALARETHDGPAVEALARLRANVATTERAWSRLPPLVSNRRGLPARVELWLKRQIKRAAHWFTWEQVNFNSAAHNALRDALAALDAHERALDAHKQLLSDVLDAHKQLRSDVLDALRRLQSEADANAARISELHARLASNVEQLRDEQHAHSLARDDELRGEVRERVEHLLEEQRVCFRQLSLEATEAAVMQDRARRQIEARIEALEKAVKRES